MQKRARFTNIIRKRRMERKVTLMKRAIKSEFNEKYNERCMQHAHKNGTKTVTR